MAWKAVLPAIERPAWPELDDARRYPYRGRGQTTPGSRMVLQINDQAVRVSADAEARGQGFVDLAGMVRHPDGGRLLIDRCGFVTTVEPTLWVRGAKAVTQLDQAVPTHLWLAAPERRPEEIPHAPRTSNAARVVDLAVGVAIAGLFAFMASTTGSVLFAVGIFVVVIGVCLFWAGYFDRLPWLSRT